MEDAEVDKAPLYEVQEGERAEADRTGIFLRLTPLIGPEKANDVFQGLIKAMMQLPEFPGPKANAIDFEASDQFKMEVRRALYSGPRTGWRLTIPYRILYTIIESDAGQQPGIIRIMRVLHGSQELNPPAE